jgi:hypothetical protein
MADFPHDDVKDRRSKDAARQSHGAAVDLDGLFAKQGAHDHTKNARNPHEPHQEKVGAHHPGRPHWLDVAYQEYQWWHNHPPAEQYEKIMTFLGAVGLKGYTDWCSAFVNYVMQHAVRKPGNVPVHGTVGGRISAGMAASWVVWAGGRQCAPRKGAITILRDSVAWCPYYHVAFLTEFAGGTLEMMTDAYTGRAAQVYRGVKVRLLGGNQGMPGGYDGHGVTIGNLYAPEVGAVFVWPSWLA